MKKFIIMALCTCLFATPVSVLAATGTGTITKGGEIVTEASDSYSVGQYKVGTDIPAGEYVLLASGGKGYFCVSSDANGDDIIENDNFEYNSILTVIDGQYLELVRCNATPIDEAGDLDVSDSGMFKVGLHIPAGEYKLNADSGEKGYYCIYNSSTQENIVSNNNFDGSQYVTVTDGQYLQLVRCSFDSIPEMSITDQETVQSAQEALNALGYDCGTPDGIVGSKTTAAVESYQQANSLDVTGNITEELVDSLLDNDNTAETTSNTTTFSTEEQFAAFESLMNRFVSLFDSANVAISECIEEEGAFGCSVNYEDRSYFIVICNPNKDGNSVLGIAPDMLDSENGAMDSLDVWSFMIQAVDESVSGYVAYGYALQACNDGEFENNEIQYSFLSSSSSFFIEGFELVANENAEGETQISVETEATTDAILEFETETETETEIETEDISQIESEDTTTEAATIEDETDSSNALEAAGDNNVLLDEDGVHVEFRGIEEYSSSSYIVDLYIENNTDSAIYVSIRDGLVNNYSIGFANNGNTIEAGAKYLASANFDYIIDVDDLEAYGITTIENLDFNLYISTEMFGDVISETPVSLNVSVDTGIARENAGEDIEEASEAIVLVDTDEYYVEYRGIEEYSSSSYIVSLYVENNSTDEIYLTLTDKLINKYAIGLGNGSTTIEAGGKYLSSPNFDFVISVDDLEVCGITTIETMTFNVNIATGMFGDTLLEMPVSLEPMFETAIVPQNEVATDKDIILDADGLYVEFRGIEEYSSSSYIVSLYVENNTKSEVYFSLKDGLINQYSISLSNNGVTILPDSKYLSSSNFDFVIDTDDLEAYGITDIETLEFNLCFSTSMFGDTISESAISLNVAG